MKTYTMSINALLDTLIKPDAASVKQTISVNNNSYTVSRNGLGLPMVTCENKPDDAPLLGIVWQEVDVNQN